MQNAFGNSKSKDEIVCLSFYEDPPVAPLSLESFEFQCWLKNKIKNIKNEKS